MNVSSSFAARLLAGLLSLCMVSLPSFATCGGGGGGGKGGVVPNSKPTDTFRVSWKSLPPGKPAPKDAGVSLVILWFPVALDVAATSPLQRSAELTALGARCVFTGLVTPGNRELRKAHGIADDKEAVVITTREGVELNRVVATPDPVLTLEQVEGLTRSALASREAQLEALFASAAKKKSAGDTAGAAADLKTIWAERCLFAPQAQRAADALKVLGIIVTASASDQRLLDPAFAPLTGPALQTVRTALESGLKAELEARYAEAEEHYVHAVTLAPNDATALRFLGEFYRHQTGQWDRAGRLFNRILENPSDPIARAVALHGLGKMTIHAGRFAEGLAMFEQSLDAYPLPITYRNLAVYWFSEKQSDKAAGYMRQALALDLADTYNQIFAAVYLAAAGQTEDALKVARANEHVLEASYNLAAIWAQAGDRAKAMELLRRQFYTYEQYDAVRAMEMKEAREDYMFTSLHADAAFDTLTKDAKNAWMIGREFCAPDQLIPLTAAPGPRM
ncbi:tetratricopeptide repeat protein [Rariglobus hedericola]|uniref:Tetratricopeptide repeat protein n=1 Tax=Rariglobus hedericola TaxID=2597822 RepID=A0A556QQG3_9BACT|nr:tetratricopeptide repeat protein [Rariglobus hedericola]TSJ78887.1 tetratricopeptide repeat protein [Rariglobus hedericola]